jgi:hypothetical protein
MGGLSTLHTSPLQEFLLFDRTDTDRAAKLASYYRNHNAPLTSADLGHMSMADGRSQASGVYNYHESTASVTLAIGGSLAKVVPAGAPVGGQGVSPARHSGDIQSFSAGSRRRLMRLIASTERRNRPLFVTLTYPDEFNPSHDKWKRDIDVFGKRFLRAFAGGSYVWRIEFKERLTGLNAGLIAPHYHLLVWGVSITDFRRFGDKAWHGVVGSGDKKHLSAGVSSERIRKWGGTMAYVSKYIAKVEAFPDGWTGRVWGVVGRADVPWAVMITLDIASTAGIKLTRLARKMLKLRGRVLPFGLTFLVNTERVLDYLEWLEVPT